MGGAPPPLGGPAELPEHARAVCSVHRACAQVSVGIQAAPMLDLSLPSALPQPSLALHCVLPQGAAALLHYPALNHKSWISRSTHQDAAANSRGNV